MQYYDVSYKTGTNEEDSVGVIARNESEAIERAQKELCSIYGTDTVKETGCVLLEAFEVESAYDKNGQKYMIKPVAVGS